MKTRGFTLTEMLVVLAILGVLLGVGIPVGRSAVAKSRGAACLGNLRSLGVALEGYLQEHQQFMPDIDSGRADKTGEAGEVPVLETVLMPYVESSDAFHCPEDFEEFERSGSSYAWNTTQSGRHVTRLSFFGIKDRPDQIPLITDKEAWHPSGTNILYADRSASNRIRFAVD